MILHLFHKKKRSVERNKWNVPRFIKAVRVLRAKNLKSHTMKKQVKEKSHTVQVRLQVQKMIK